jgi:hypothetical protein
VLVGVQASASRYRSFAIDPHRRLAAWPSISATATRSVPLPEDADRIPERGITERALPRPCERSGPGKHSARQGAGPREHGRQAARSERDRPGRHASCTRDSTTPHAAAGGLDPIEGNSATHGW